MKKLALFAIFLGGPTAYVGWSHISALGAEVRAEIDAMIPDARKVAEIEAGLAKRDNVLVIKRADLDSHRDTIEGYDREIAKLESRIENERTVLERADRLLASGNKYIVVHGQRYSRSEVERDAIARAESLEHASSELEAKRQARNDLSAAVANGESALDDATAQQRRLREELAALQARIQSAKQRKENRELLANFHLERDEALAEQFEELRKRAKYSEALAKATDSRFVTGKVVDWEGRRAPRDARAAIAKALGRAAEHDDAAPASTLDDDGR